MDKHHLDQVVRTHIADIADIAIWQRCLNQDPNYFPPTIPAEVFASLPPTLREAINHYETNEEKSIALLSSLTTLAAGLHDIKIPYRKKTINCNLFQVIVGPPASNKGISIHSRMILNKIQLRLNKNYLIEKAKYNKHVEEQRLNKNKSSREEEENLDISEELYFSIDSYNSEESSIFNIISESSLNNNESSSIIIDNNNNNDLDIV